MIKRIKTAAGDLTIHIRPRPDMDPGLWILQGLNPLDPGPALGTGAAKQWQRTFATYAVGFTFFPSGDLADKVLDLESIVRDHAVWLTEWTALLEQQLGQQRCAVKFTNLGRPSVDLSELRIRFPGITIEMEPWPDPPPLPPPV